MQYQIIVGASGFLASDFNGIAQDLAKRVTQAIDDGWVPTGGVTVGVTVSTRAPSLMQAMIKPDEAATETHTETQSTTETPQELRLENRAGPIPVKQSRFPTIAR